MFFTFLVAPGSAETPAIRSAVNFRFQRCHASPNTRPFFEFPGNHVDAEISRTGATMQPACRWSISYALGSASLDSDVWQMVAMTFDGKAIRAFVNGSLDYRPPHRLHPVGDPCNETWQNPAPVSTWSDRTSWGPGGDPAAPQNHTTFAVGGQRGAEGAGLGHPWDGLLGGLAVYDRALEEEELQAMAANTGMANP